MRIVRVVSAVAKGFALLVVAWLVVLYIWARVGSAPELGTAGGRLRPCPPTPNCVATRDAAQLMPTLPMRGDATATLGRLGRIIATQPRATIVERRHDYLRAEFRSRLFRFADDVEFQVVETDGVVHFRSASRIGRGDLGVNRARMEALSATYLAP